MTVLVVGFVGGSLPFCCGFALLGPGLLAVGWWLRSSFSSVFVSGVFPPLLVRTPPRFASVLAVSGFVLALISRDLRLSLVLVVWFSLFLFFFPRRYLRFFQQRDSWHFTEVSNWDSRAQRTINVSLENPAQPGVTKLCDPP